MKISRVKDLIAAPESAFHIELTNDNSLVNCDYEGNPVAGAVYETSEVLLFYGGQDAWSQFNVTCQATGITATLNQQKHTVTPSAIKSDTATITVTATHKTRTGLVLQAVYTLSKNKPGKPGEKAVSYSLIPSLHVVRKNNKGVLLDTQISFIVHKRVGADLTVITTFKQLFENVLDIKIGDSYIGDSSKGNQAITAKTSDYWGGSSPVELRLEHEVDTSICYDSETIGVVTDGDDSVFYWITSTVASIAANENGEPLTPGQAIELSEWKRVGKAAAAKSSDLTLRVYTVKKGEKQYFGQQNWAPTANFTAEAANGCDSLLAELLDSSGNIVFSLPIPVEWQGKSGNDGVTYEIVPSVASIRADKDGNVQTGIIQVSAYRIKGTDRVSCGLGMAAVSGPNGETAPYYWAQYRIDDGTWTNCSSISVGSSIYLQLAYGVPASAVSTIKSGIAFRLLYGTGSTSSSVVHEMAALQVVKDGQTGAQGKTGRFYYYDGYFNSAKEYTATDHQAPYVAFDYETKITDSTTNTEVTVVKTSYHMLVAATNKKDGSLVPPRPLNTAAGRWEEFESTHQFLIAQAFFTNFAKLGSAVFSGDWMISQYGTPGITFVSDEKSVLSGIVNTRKVSLATLATLKNIDGTYKTTNTTYTTLRNYYSVAKLQKAIDQAVWAVDNNATLDQLLAMSATSYQLFGVDAEKPFKLFAPNIAFDFLKGKAYLHDADIQGSINALSGTFRGEVYASSGVFSGEVYASGGEFKGTVRSNLFYSGVKTLTQSPYTINPASEPFNWFFISENSSSFFIYLPKASNYDGLEINILIKHTSWTADKMVHVCVVSGDYICYKPNVYSDGNGHTMENYNKTFVTLTGPNSLYCPPNQINKFKSIGGRWYAVGGLFTGE